MKNICKTFIHRKLVIQFQVLVVNHNFIHSKLGNLSPNIPSKNFLCKLLPKNTQVGKGWRRPLKVLPRKGRERGWDARYNIFSPTAPARSPPGTPYRGMPRDCRLSRHRPQRLSAPASPGLSIFPSSRPLSVCSNFCTLAPLLRCSSLLGARLNLAASASGECMLFLAVFSRLVW